MYIREGADSTDADGLGRAAERIVDALVERCRQLESELTETRDENEALGKRINELEDEISDLKAGG